MTTRHVTFLAAFGLALVVGLPAFAAPSFDCAKAGSDVEHAICELPELQWLDRQMARLYGFVKAAADEKGRAALVQAQRAFIAERDACEPTYFCIQAAYHARLKQLSAMTPFGDPFAIYRMESGAGADAFLSGELTVVRMGGIGAAQFFTVGANGHTCVAEFDEGEISGKGNIRATLADACSILIEPNGDDMTVSTKGCETYCGMRASLDGRYDLVQD